MSLENNLEAKRDGEGSEIRETQWYASVFNGEVKKFCSRIKLLLCCKG